ncbi:MAG: tryptophan--tRNA ligase [Thermaerobacter sp.]|nr:tryptophan--tRNA ligase [Bacillota bacterium]REJ38381.1 MAG: tryptophan--tRNA ligase [Bacillota bacterium]
MKGRRVLSGMRPTGRVHLGNYLGAVRNWVRLQDEYDCFYAIVDYHGITTPFSPAELNENIEEMVVDLLACGIDPERAVVFVQSDVPEHTELAWILGAMTPLGWLERVPTFKEKAAQHPDHINLGLLGYPVLQTADIIIYKAEAVPVGEDQLPHLELAREIVRRFNHQFGPVFPEPQAIVTRETARIMSLTEPEKKMSKSLGPDSYVALADEPDEVRRKLRRAVTDVGPRPDGEMSPGVRNLFGLLEIFGSPDEYRTLRQQYDAGTLRYVELKDTLAEALIRHLEPIRLRRAELAGDRRRLRAILDAGAERARSVARATLDEVRRAIGVGLAFRERP